VDDARRLAEGIAARVGIMAEYVQPAYEDPTDRMLKQGLIPENVDPSDPKIDDPRERARILNLFDRHLSEPAGFVLPLHPWTAQAKPSWLSEIWQTRRGRLFLVPGDSPLGFRLPLQSLPEIDPLDYPHLTPADPFAERQPLSDPRVTIRSKHPPCTPRPAMRPRRRSRRRPCCCNGRSPLRPPLPRCRCARRSPSKCVTADCACSCPRWRRLPTISNCSP